MTLPRSWFPILAKSVEETLFGGRIEKIRAPRDHEIVLTVRAGGEKRHLLLSAHPRFPRFHFIAEAPESAVLSEFVRILRKHALGGKVESVLVPPGERIVEVGVRAGHGIFRVVAECFPGKANLFLVDGESTVLSMHRRRREKGRALGPGKTYQPPPPIGAPMAAEEEPLPEENLHGRLETTFREKEDAYTMERLAGAVGKRLKRLIRKERKRRVNLSRDLAGAGDPERWRRCGELLKIHAGRVEKGVLEVEVPDVFEPDAKPTVIPLDPRLGLEGNMEAYFRKYRKARSGRKRIDGLLGETEDKLREAEGMAERLARAEEAGDVDAVASLAEALGVEPPGAEGTKPREKAEAGPRPPYRRFVSREGLPIWVGRTDAENDRLSTREARGRDLWLHVDGFGGSHVLVRLPREKAYDRETLLDAANLAAFFSQARGKRVDVSYTEAKHVRKTKRAKPGQVSMARRSVIRIEPDAARLERLLGKPPTLR
ncbi:MAG: Rqc2 family fibronectin-binding protein [Planctomycetota bacterium]|jgi:predicted ribosome quality control (RQC) complex YloA/Tae2 family protein